MQSVQTPLQELEVQVLLLQEKPGSEVHTLPYYFEQHIGGGFWHDDPR